VQTLSEICLDEDSPATVLVTHHVEEIPEGITHCLLLNLGRIVAAGPIDQALTSDNLSAAFGMALSVGKSDGRWSARGVR
jgi:iron complex transport system ATP-binding protein